MGLKVKPKKTSPGGPGEVFFIFSEIFSEAI